jgi:hypothetical protein
VRYAKLTPAPVSGGSAPTPWIIADDSIRGAGSRFLVSGWPGVKQIDQSLAYLDKPFQTNIPWANREVTFQLLTELEFNDEDECFLFTCRLSLDCPMAGGLEMGVVDGGLVFFPNAVIRSVTPVSGASDPTVVSMRLLYDVNAGAPG